MSMSDDEPNEITNDENVTGGAGGADDGSADEVAEVDCFEDDEAAGAASAPPLARRSRMTNPCSSSAIFPSPLAVPDVAGTLPQGLFARKPRRRLKRPPRSV